MTPGQQITALERAEAIAGWVYDRKREPAVFAELAEKIHRAIIEHSNAELERRRKVEARMREAATAVRVLRANVAPSGSDWFGSGENCSLQRKASSGSTSRRAASALIAKIPFALAEHIGKVYYPGEI